MSIFSKWDLLQDNYINVVERKINSISGNIDYGTYTPTITSLINLDNVSGSVANYFKIGNVVQVNGQFTVNATATLLTSFEMSLPIPSNITNTYDLSGLGLTAIIAGLTTEIVGEVTNNTAKVQWLAAIITQQVCSYSFSYIIR